LSDQKPLVDVFKSPTTNEAQQLCTIIEHAILLK